MLFPQINLWAKEDSCIQTTQHPLSNQAVDQPMKLAECTKKLLQQPPALTPGELHDAIVYTIEALSKDSSENTMVPIACFFTALRATGLDHKAEYIASAASAVLQFSSVVDSSQLVKASTNDELSIIDIVGTGGDGQNTFNVSTSSAIVASGIPGIKVCKHGGKASTSNSGAGDLINVLGCDSSKVTASTLPQIWNDNSFTFLLAPYFHDGMKHVALLRKLMGIPTIFNVLGPLLHPVSHVQKRVLGVFSKQLAPEYAKAAKIIYPSSETFVVFGEVGLDEVSPIGDTLVWHVKPSEEEIEVFRVNPSDFGLQEHPLSECPSLGPHKNADILYQQILAGKFKKGDNSIYDYILLNTALLYCLSSGTKDWKSGVQAAEQSIHSGAAKRSLDHFVQSVTAL